MKTFSGHARRWGRWETMACSLWAIGCVLILGGCGKHESAKPSAAVLMADTTPSTAAMAPPSGNAAMIAPAVIAVNPAGGADLRQLNHAYLRWIVQNRRRPKDYEDFIAASGIQVPPAPDGKKYIIDKNGFIALASR